MNQRMALIKGQQITKVFLHRQLSRSWLEALASYATQQKRFKTFTIQRDCFISSTFASLVNILQQRFGFPAKNSKKATRRFETMRMRSRKHEAALLLLWVEERKKVLV